MLSTGQGVVGLLGAGQDVVGSHGKDWRSGGYTGEGAAGASNVDVRVWQRTARVHTILMEGNKQTNTDYVRSRAVKRAGALCVCVVWDVCVPCPAQRP